AEPRTSVLPLKTLLDSQADTTPEADAEAPTGADAADVAKMADIQVLGERKMAENEVQTPPVQDDAVKALEGKVDALTENMNRILAWAEEQPSIKNAGYISETGGKSDQHIKSFGDWLKAVQRNDVQRLTTVYGSTKAMSED